MAFQQPLVGLEDFAADSVGRMDMSGSPSGARRRTYDGRDNAAVSVGPGGDRGADKDTEKRSHARICCGGGSK